MTWLRKRKKKVTMTWIWMTIVKYMTTIWLLWDWLPSTDVALLSNHSTNKKNYPSLAGRRTRPRSTSNSARRPTLALLRPSPATRTRLASAWPGVWHASGPSATSRPLHATATVYSPSQGGRKRHTTWWASSRRIWRIGTRSCLPERMRRPRWPGPASFVSNTSAVSLFTCTGSTGSEELPPRVFESTLISWSQ